MRWIVIATCLMVSFAAAAADTPATSPATDEARQEAAALAKTIGMEAMMTQMMSMMREQMVASVARNIPRDKAEIAVDEIFMPEIRSRVGELSATIADIWASHFDVAELRQLREFYETPLGQKAIQTMPGLMVEAQKAGADWGRRVARDAIAKNGDKLRALSTPQAK